MSQLKSRSIEAALTTKGFRKQEGGRDHQFYFYFHNGCKTSVFTKISHGDSEIGDFLIGLMAKQVKLAKAQFVALVACTLSSAEYKAFLIDCGHVKE